MSDDINNTNQMLMAFSSAAVFTSLQFVVWIIFFSFKFYLLAWHAGCVRYAKNPSAEKFLYILWQLYAGANQKIKSYRRTEMIALSGKLHQQFFWLDFSSLQLGNIFFSVAIAFWACQRVKTSARRLTASTCFSRTIV